MTAQEVKELLLTRPSETYFVAQPLPNSAFARTVDFRQGDQESVQRILDTIFSNAFLTFTIAFNNSPRGRSCEAAAWPSHGLYADGQVPGNHQCSSFRIERTGRVVANGGSTYGSDSDFGVQLAPLLQRHVYRFNAERMNVGRCPHGPNTALDGSASNLPEVLGELQSNSARFRELNTRLSEILPQIKWVSVHATDRQNVEILVWPHDPESKRDDLAIPILECGTGVAQVLAILYVVMTSERGQVIAIDEPQSFLHPGAARKLIEFLNHYPQHQFIVATHSPGIIAAASPRTITLATCADGETDLRQIDTTVEKGIQATLGELGVRLSDVFGADNILWVEGRTEEKPFPIIVEKVLRRPLLGTQILGIRETGDLEGRDAKRIFEIYRRLAGGVSLVPPALAYILDDECRSDEVKREMSNLSRGRVRFLSRRMYENYLLNPDAIAWVMNSSNNFREPPVTPAEILSLLEAKLREPAFYRDKTVPPPDQRRVKAHAGQILESAFLELSEQRVQYHKVAHGEALTSWLAGNAPADLAEVSELIGSVLGA